MDDKLIGIEEAAALLDESVDTLYHTWNKDPLKSCAFKFPGKKKIKFSYNKLQEYIAAQLQEG